MYSIYTMYIYAKAKKWGGGRKPLLSGNNNYSQTIKS